MKYDLVIFDLDGTLADTLPWFLSIVNDVAERFSFRKIDPDNIEHLRTYSAGELIRYLGIPGWKMPFIAAHMRKLASQHVEKTPLFPGAHDMLMALHAADVKVAVVSSNSAANIRSVLGGANVAVSQVEGGVSIFGKAPKIRKVMKRAGVAPGRVLTVGDEIRDADAAKRAGVAYGAIGWGMTKPEALKAQNPAEYFDSVADLTACVAGG